MPPDAETVLVDSGEALGRLRDDWEALASRMGGSPTLDHDWQMACATALHAEGGLHVLTVRDAGTLVAAAPLAYDRARRRLALLGAATLYEPTDCLHASEAAADHLARAVVRSGLPAVLERVPHGGAIVRALERNAGRRAVTIVRPAGASNGVPVRQPWSDYLAGLSGRTRRSLDKHLQQLAAAAGPVAVTTTAPAPAEVADLLERLAEIEASGWKGRHGTSLAQQPVLRRFFLDYARRVAARGQLRVTALTAGSTTVAMELAVVAHGRRWGLKVAYQEALAAHAPAVQVVHASIQRAFEEGLQGYEFLGSAESWQERWRPERREQGLVVLYPLNVRGLWRAADDLRLAAGRRLAGAGGG